MKKPKNTVTHGALDGRKRYRWAKVSNAAYLYQTEGWIMSPYFYVTPNYSDNAGTATVIATQATYAGAPHFKGKDVQTLFVKAYAEVQYRRPEQVQDHSWWQCHCIQRMCMD